MRLKLPEKSLFAYLLRSPWWVSFLFALLYALVARYFVDEKYLPYALIFTVPLVISGVITGVRQWRVPSESQVASTIKTVSEMSGREFKALMNQTFQREGYAVTSTDGVSDLKLEKAGRISLVSCKRWKAASHGAEVLMELEAVRDAQRADEAIYVAIGRLTENAKKFAADHGIRLITGPELTLVLQRQK